MAEAKYWYGQTVYLLETKPIYYLQAVEKFTADLKNDK